MTEIKLEASGPMQMNWETGELELLTVAPKLQRGQKIYAFGYAMAQQIFAVVNPDLYEIVEVGSPDDVNEYSLERYFSPISHYDKYIKPVSKQFGIGFYYAENEPIFSEDVIKVSLQRAELIEKMRDEREKAAEDASRKNKDELRKKYSFLTVWDGEWRTRYKTASGNLRELLKKEFPGVKFSVRKDGSGDTVNITWTDGPTRKMVDEIAGQFEGRRFNGMEDCEEIVSSDFTDLFGSLGYIFTEREYSESVMEREKMKVIEDYPLLADGKEHHRDTLGDIKASEYGFDFCWLSAESTARHRLWDVDLTERPAKAKLGNLLAALNPYLNLTIIDYSDKSIAVIGETKAVKDRLREMGGRFNAKLSCGPGWIFSKSKKDEITAAFGL